METRLMNNSEILTATANIKRVEAQLGRPIPGGMIDPSDYKDKLLTNSEVNTVVANIKRVDFMRGNSEGGLGSAIGGLIILALVGIMIIDSTFGTDIFNSIFDWILNL